MSVQMGRVHGCRNRRGQGTSRIALVVQEEVWESVTNRAELSGSNLFFQHGFVQLSKETAVRVRMCITDS